MAELRSVPPLNELPYMLLAVANCVDVLALPAKLAVIIPALKLPLPSLFTKELGVFVEVADAMSLAIAVIVEELTPPILFDELVILETTKAAVATSVLFAASDGVGAVGFPVNVGDTIVLFVKDSVPVKVAIVPVVGNVIFVSPTLVNVVLKLPAVVNAFAVVILPPNVIVFPELSTPVPPYCPVIGPVKAVVPSKSLPYILTCEANFVLVLALPAKLAVMIPALKLPLPSLFTKELGVFVEVADAMSLAIEVIVEELTPPILFEELVILELTKAAVATSVPFAASVGVVAVGAPVKEGDEIIGDTIVLFVKVSVPAKVAIVPVVGNVIFVSPILVNVVLKLPAVVKVFAVVILPPKVIVFPELSTPVPPYCPAIAKAKGAVPSKSFPYILTCEANFVLVLALPAKLAVMIPALKLPLPSLFTKVLGVLVEVAEATSLAMVVIVEELTPPTLFTFGKSPVPPKSPAN